MIVAINTRFLLASGLEGIGVYTHEICRRMVENHPETSFHFFFDRSYDESFIYGPNVTPHILFPPARHPLLWYWWFEMSVPLRLTRIGAEVFFSPDMYLSLTANVPTLMTSHDLAYLHYPGSMKRGHLRYYQKYVKLFHEHAQSIACVSETTRQDILTQFQIEDDKLFVATNAASENFEPLSDERMIQFREEYTNGQAYILYLGAIHPRKNIPFLIKAFDRYKSTCPDPLKLVLAGRWAWKNHSLKSTIGNTVSKNDIICLDHFSGSVTNLVGSAEMLVYPSLLEGFGIPILEAMRSGVPVITSNRSSMPEVAGDAAILIDPENTADLTESIRRVRNNPSFKANLVKKGLEREKHFNWTESSEKIYSKLLQLAGYL